MNIEVIWEQFTLTLLSYNNSYLSYSKNGGNLGVAVEMIILRISHRLELWVSIKIAIRIF